MWVASSHYKSQMPNYKIQERLARSRTKDQERWSCKIHAQRTKYTAGSQEPGTKDQEPRKKSQGPRAKDQDFAMHGPTAEYHIYIYIYVCRSGIPIFQISDFPISRSPEFQLSRFADFVGQTLRSQPDPIPNPCTHACRDHKLRKEPSLAYAL